MANQLVVMLFFSLVIRGDTKSSKHWNCTKITTKFYVRGKITTKIYKREEIPCLKPPAQIRVKAQSWSMQRRPQTLCLLVGLLIYLSKHAGGEPYISKFLPCYALYIKLLQLVNWCVLMFWVLLDQWGINHISLTLSVPVVTVPRGQSPNKIERWLRIVTPESMSIGSPLAAGPTVVTTYRLSGSYTAYLKALSDIPYATTE